MLTLLSPVFLLLACGGADPGPADDSGPAADSAPDDTDTDTDSGGGTPWTAQYTLHESPALTMCGIRAGENWGWTGTCPRMTVHVAITIRDCVMAIDYLPSGGMTMGMPYAGTIVGETVDFADGDTVTGCTGTIEAPDRITGGCDGGCTFVLEHALRI